MLRIFIPATLLMLIGCTRTEVPNADAPGADAAPVVLQDALTASVNGEWRSDRTGRAMSFGIPRNP